ncbi:hypothetical protein [Tolypothrix sp. NIES-4075]|uniref:hypothetical protein n=1 Tax=Tolypothrix sp. NIES-4075 TaxID=2005459 RepID=UPI00117C5978|nr:hypothetical protein [Tolypothrix sp. NIES-4075]
MARLITPNPIFIRMSGCRVSGVENEELVTYVSSGGLECLLTRTCNPTPYTLPRRGFIFTSVPFDKGDRRTILSFYYPLPIPPSGSPVASTRGTRARRWTHHSPFPITHSSEIVPKLKQI